jgi:serine protease inhibitor
MTGIFGSALHQKPPQEFPMIVDHPFFAVIRDERTKTILLMGWIRDPQ